VEAIKWDSLIVQEGSPKKSKIFNLLWIITTTLSKLTYKISYEKLTRTRKAYLNVDSKNKIFKKVIKATSKPQPKNS
jgi:hypothetical protein